MAMPIVRSGAASGQKSYPIILRPPDIRVQALGLTPRQADFLGSVFPYLTNPPQLGIFASFDAVCRRLASSDPNPNLALVVRAQEYAWNAHSGKFRKSGEPFAAHPAAVAEILAYELGVKDPEIISGGLLHDVVEDTKITIQEIKAAFGKRVARLVDAVTKIDSFESAEVERAQVETYQKILLGMKRDIAVILIKLADRLHNMRTLIHLSPNARKRMAKETLDIYVPLANALGLGLEKRELEDLSFQYLMPDEFKRTKFGIDKLRAENKKLFAPALATIQDALKSFGAEIGLSPRTYYEHYNISFKRGENPGEAFDAQSISITVPTEQDCYAILPIIYGLYRPIEGSIKNYIANPKPNTYQGIHVWLAVSGAGVLRVQIRTPEMNDTADRGFLTVSSEDWWKLQPTFFNQLLHILNERGLDVKKIINGIGQVSFRIKVYTPRMKRLELPYGSTVLDFAFSVHGDIGLSAISARINGVDRPLACQLKEGDVVRIIKGAADPTPEWFRWTALSESHRKLRSYFSNLLAFNKAHARKLAVKALNDMLKEKGLHLTAAGIMKDIPLRKALFSELTNSFKDLEIAKLNDLFTAILLGKLSPLDVALKIEELFARYIQKLKAKKRKPLALKITFNFADRIGLYSDISKEIGDVGINIEANSARSVRGRGRGTVTVYVYAAFQQRQLFDIFSGYTRGGGDRFNIRKVRENKPQTPS
ncbi:HD domain-containing protein [Candidatus Saganbacteria bacterium]|nr:HD domain-containing protein [Candidatus Saganbacteria bacterium]